MSILGEELKENHLNIKSQNMITRASENGSNKIIKTCRICLEKGQIKNDATENFVSPCKCVGSFQFMHESCLIQWINTHLQQRKGNDEEETHISCDMCKQDISFTTIKRYKCRRASEVKEGIKYSSDLFIFGIVTIIILGALLGSAVYIQSQIVNEATSNGLSIAMKVAMGVLGAAIGIWIGVIIFNILVKIQESATKVQSKTDKSKKSPSEKSFKFRKGLFVEGSPTNNSTTKQTLNQLYDLNNKSQAQAQTL